jgi:plastocyanin
VPVGTTVTWINKDADDHSATCDGVFDVFVKGNGGSNRFTFTKTGTYAYHCAFHTAMFATIIVV